LLSEVKARGHILFGSLGRGVTNKGKNILWLCITDAVNKVGLQGRTLAEIKKKWADLKSHQKYGLQLTEPVSEPQEVVVGSLTCPLTTSACPN